MLKYGFNEFYPGFWEKGMESWIRKPFKYNKFLLVSWRMSGSEFCKELIRENYPEISKLNYWGKSHAILDLEIVKKLQEANTKVFVSITDPREIATNVVNFDNGFHFHEYDYSKNSFENILSSHFLNETADKQIELIDFYQKHFGNNCIVLRYEDAVFNVDKFLKQTSKFLDLKPLNVDGSQKYKWSMYKSVGWFGRFFPEEELLKHYNERLSFYKQWEYPEEGLQGERYNWPKENDIIEFPTIEDIPTPPPPKFI